MVFWRQTDGRRPTGLMAAAVLVSSKVGGAVSAFAGAEAAGAPEAAVDI